MLLIGLYPWWYVSVRKAYRRRPAILKANAGTGLACVIGNSQTTFGALMQLPYAITAITRGSLTAAALVLLYIFAGGMAATARAAPSHDAIEAAIQGFVTATLRGDYISFQAEVGALDPRLRRTPCGTALRSFLPPGSRLPGNATVGVTCDDQRPWTIYVPVAVKVTSKVAVMQRLAILPISC